MTYVESKNKLDELRRTNEAMFRMAISHLMDCGIRNLTEENIEANCKEIMKEDDTNHFMTNEFQCNLIRLAGELAKIDHIHLLVYISREMYYGVDDIHISYKRAIELLKGCLDYCVIYVADSFESRGEAGLMGFTDDDIEELGYGWMIGVEEEDE